MEFMKVPKGRAGARNGGGANRSSCSGPAIADRTKSIDAAQSFERMRTVRAVLFCCREDRSGSSLTSTAVNGVTLADGDHDIPTEGPFFGSGGGGFKGHVVVSDIRFTDLSFFNGKDLTGWFGAKDHWRVENGEIVGAFPAGVEPTDTCLWSARECVDFELSCQVRLKHRVAVKGKAGHSMVILRGAISDPTRYLVGGLKCMLAARIGVG